MDPNACLRRIRSLREQLNVALAACDEADVHRLSAELSNAVADLDDWLMGGGFLPDDWRRAGK